MQIKGKFGSKTDIGLVRPSNEDKALSLIDADGNILLCVCDGMGGYMKGDFASKIATDILSSAFKSKMKWIFDFQVTMWIDKMVRTINYSVYNEGNDSDALYGMGTTLCFVVFFKGKIFIANVGDSRCYFLEKDEIKQMTRDQTYVEYLVAYKEIDEDEKRTSKDRHALMNFIGQRKTVDYQLIVEKNEKKTVLLCSDGLYNNATNQQIYSVLSSQERLDQKISTLIGVANSNGGTDNIAVSIWEPYQDD